MDIRETYENSARRKVFQWDRRTLISSRLQSEAVLNEAVNHGRLYFCTSKVEGNGATVSDKGSLDPTVGAGKFQQSGSRIVSFLI